MAARVIIEPTVQINVNATSDSGWLGSSKARKIVSLVPNPATLIGKPSESRARGMTLPSTLMSGTLWQAYKPAAM
jgi:hypothetical protein